MKLFVYLAACFYLTSCTWSGIRTPSSTEVKGRHIIVTLHGVRGNDVSYGDFHSIIKGNLEKLDPSYSVETINWTYPVGSKVEEVRKDEFSGKEFLAKTWGPHEIAKKFNYDMFIGPNPLIKDLGPNDKISLIAYSMGGLMAMSWYYDTMFNFAGSKSVKYSADIHANLLKKLERVENVIGLGAVYWGSLDAEVGWTVLENGDLKEIKKVVPKVKAFCASADVQKITEGQSLWATTGNTIAGWFGAKQPELTTQQKNERFVKNATLAACNSVNFIEGSYILKAVDKVPDAVLSGVKKGMAAGGNVSVHEIDNMRLTSDAINVMRVGRINHLTNQDLKTRFKARWSSIVGVFPCLGKKDKGLTCTEFVSEDYKRVNDGLVTLFSGLYRRETDGPVMSPSAVADFLFYTEAPGNENSSISADQFQNTQQIQKSTQVSNKDIFVENMHATVVPALEALSGVGKKGADKLMNFDATLGVDVVIVNKECADPATCKHPNYKHMLQVLGNCDIGNPTCDQNYMNKFYSVSSVDQQLLENNKLKEELGSFVLTMNIRVPKDVKFTEYVKQNLVSGFRFPYVKYTPGIWGDQRMDAQDSPYGLQIGRSSEVMSSYAVVKTEGNYQVVRAFFVGRAWAKPGRVAEAKQLLNEGVPVNLQVNIPGVKSRVVSAKIKPTYTTYVDMYMK